MPPENDKLKKQRQLLHSYARYSGVAFQMLGIMAVFIFGGWKLDQHFQTNTPWITAIMAILGIALALFTILKQVKS